MVNKGDSSDAARAQVGTNGGLSQRWREAADTMSVEGKGAWQQGKRDDADELDAAKLRIEEAVKALPGDNWADEIEEDLISRDAVLKIIREIL